VSAKLLEGKTLALEIQNTLKTQIQDCVQQGYRQPHLAVILIGSDPASTVYVRNKRLACQATGIRCTVFELPPSVSMAALLSDVKRLNDDPNVDGILIQLPLPPHLDKAQLIDQIDPEKDVDGFHPYNIGLLAQQRPGLRPCTPMGIMALLALTQVPLAGLRATVVGVSDIVGRPMILELLRAQCTVTACHSLTQDLKAAVENAELLVVAAGSPHLIQGDWIQPGSIVIDVGMNRRDNDAYVGDVEFECAKERAAWITPVPGGVGPMTVASLLKNTLIAYQNRILKPNSV
jgi:methylenetetrahydrofolate dehydrogenase (NADP+)/methenyltetrahydrofolate cyclohydrolase